MRSKIEGLLDDNRYKLMLLIQLSMLSGSVGNQVERKHLLIHDLKLCRERGRPFGPHGIEGVIRFKSAPGLPQGRDTIGGRGF